MFLALTTMQAALLIAGLALAVILAWKFLKLAFKVAILGALIFLVYWIGTKAGWWAPLF